MTDMTISRVRAYPLAMRNGDIVPVAQASIPVSTSALYGVLGVYETVEIVQGHPFFLLRHLARLDESARMSGFNLGTPADQVAEWLPELLSANEAREALLRIVVIDLGEEVATYFLYLMKTWDYPAAWYEEGVPVTTFQGARSFPLIKSLNTLVPGLARRKAAQLGVHDALLINHEGHVTEGSNCNVCAVIDGTLVTAPYGAALEGITLTTVLGEAARLGIPVERRPLPADEIAGWQEAFLTSTRRHVLPIRRVDDHVMSVGPVTRALMVAFMAVYERTLASAADGP